MKKDPVREAVLPGADGAAVPRDISGEMRDRYVAFRRAQAELTAWMEFSADHETATETDLRDREAAALDSLVKLPAATLADVAIKLQVLKDQSSSGPEATSEMVGLLAEDGLWLVRPIRELEARITALRLTMTLLLNAAAGDRDSLNRAREAVLDLIESPTSPCGSNPQLKQVAKDEVGALFNWLD